MINRIRIMSSEVIKNVIEDFMSENLENLEESCTATQNKEEKYIFLELKDSQENSPRDNEEPGTFSRIEASSSSNVDTVEILLPNPENSSEIVASPNSPAVTNAEDNDPQNVNQTMCLGPLTERKSRYRNPSNAVHV